MVDPMKTLQQLCYHWAIRAFGQSHTNNHRLRALRLLEEAVELAQAHGIEKSMVKHCVDVVYSRPAGLTRSEIGGVLMTTAVYCSARQMDMEETLAFELDRVLSKPVEHFYKRNQEKMDLGLIL